jgi:hypothetical protein
MILVELPWPGRVPACHSTFSSARKATANSQVHGHLITVWLSLPDAPELKKKSQVGGQGSDRTGNSTLSIGNSRNDGSEAGRSVAQNSFLIGCQWVKLKGMPRQNQSLMGVQEKRLSSGEEAPRLFGFWTPGHLGGGRGRCWGHFGCLDKAACPLGSPSIMSVLWGFLPRSPLLRQAQERSEVS